MKRILSAAIVVASITGTAAFGEPSEACVYGFVPPSSSSAGIGVRQSTGPGEASVTACNDGSVVPVPGAVRATASTSKPSAVVSVDGDPEWTTLGCTDGYVAAGVGPDGPKLYQGSDGGFSSRARAKSPDEFAGALLKDCVPATPAA